MRQQHSRQGAKMDKTTISESLRALAKETSTRSQIGRVREVFDDIETAQRSGATMAEIVKTLNRQGFEISLTSLQTALARIRKQRREAAGLEPSHKGHKRKVEPIPAPRDADTSNSAQGESSNVDKSPEMDAIREALNNKHGENKLQQYEKPQKKLGVKQ